MFKTIPFQYDEALKREIDLHGYSYQTFKNYRCQLRRIADFFSKDIADITIEEMKSYLLRLKSVLKRSPQSLNVCRAAYYFFNQCVMGRDLSPYALPKHKLSRPLPDIISQDRIVLVLSALCLKHRAILSLCYGSGLRISEALSVRTGDIDSTNMRVFVRDGKGHKQRYSILSIYSLTILRKYYKAFRPKGAYLFPRRHDDDMKANPQHSQLAFKREYTRLFPKESKRITIHTLRHCFATHLLDSGVDLRTIQILLGHKSIKSTCIYTHLTTKHFSQLVSPLDRAGGDSLEE
ncbi:MAG: site-specific integrase [Clostridiales Family XIII bacterium]|jgi:site-specific recombinase XerD|nr:site-specific integrase [Clostridiales Family XIII bacterium]